MDKEFFMNSSIPPQVFQYDDPFGSTWQSQDYFLSTPPSNDHFESALSSMVSSPSASNSVISTDNIMMRELIGKLGNICNSNDLPNYMNSTNCSTNNSCYTTPLSSPPKISRSMPIIDHFINENFPSLGNSIGFSSNLPAMPSDPGFAERAARFSSFGSTSFNGRTTINQFGLSNVHKLCGENEKLYRVSSSTSLNDSENGSNRKRKAAFSKRKGKEFESHSQMPTNSNKVVGNGNETNAKRSRSDESKGKKGDTAKTEENKGGGDDQKCPEPPKDYIHVRARRGQATDSHSLAERVRREKISERMKFLQDLVPGCNRVTGKALMLDEIINYVESLQRQVEFLSMKLSTVNPELELNMNNHFTKDEMKPNWCLPHPMVPTQYGEPHQNPLQDSPSCSMDPFNTILNYNCLPKLPSLCNGDVQSFFEMRSAQKENGFQVQNILHGPNPRQMKKELYPPVVNMGSRGSI